VTEALALLRVVNNVRDDAALVTVLRGAATGLSDDALCALRRGATQRGGDRSLWNAATDDAVTSELPDADRATLARTLETIRWARRQRGARPLAEMLLGVLLRLDIDLALLASGPGGAKAWANLTRLVRIVEEYETVRSGDLGGLLAYLAELQAGAYAESGAALEGEEGAVRVMSIHAAKGLEFPVVVVGALDRRGPGETIAMARVDDAPLVGMRLPDGGGPTLGSELVRKARKAIADAEEARLLYVACTRAEEALTLVVRSDPSADAGEQERMGARVRQALGMAGSGAVQPGTHLLGAGTVTVEVVVPAPSPDGPGAAADAECDTLASIRPPDQPPQAYSAPRIVSYSGLSLYETCPYRYYATTIARMPQPPTDSGADARAFGVAAHGLLARWASGTPVDAGGIAAAAAAAGLGPAEVPRLARAIEVFVGSDLAHEALSAPRVRAEVPIAVPVAGCVLVGAIDLLAEDGDEATIIDYKTGAGAADAAEASERYRLQGACYALAALTGGAEQVRVVFAEIETGRRTEYRYAGPDRPALEAAVGAIIERMRAGEYAPRLAYDPVVCGSCPALGSLCPVTRRSGVAE
jgi:ATP-dependent helicase/nuclease subunit A